MSEAVAIILTCNRCGEAKPSALFKADRRNTKRGYSSFCTECHKAATIAWQKKTQTR